MYRLPFQVYKNGYFLIHHLLFCCKKFHNLEMTQNVTDLALVIINQFYYIHRAKILIRFEVEERNVEKIFLFSLARNLLGNHILTYIILEISAFHSTCFGRM